MHSVDIFYGDSLKKYAFPNGHPFSIARVEHFWDVLKNDVLLNYKSINVEEPVMADQNMLLTFHIPEYVNFVKNASKAGIGYLDNGDTPAFKGIFEAASTSVGSTLRALEKVMTGEINHAFNPIGGLHHAWKDKAAGFCVFNDVAIAILEAKRLGLDRILYVDIDAHHGDGVFYEFYDDPAVFIVDIHEDGRYLYPGTGFSHEIGEGDAIGTKKNIPLPIGSGLNEFREAFDQVEKFAIDVRPQIVLLQCGADGLKGDPLTHLNYTVECHRLAIQSLHRIAHEFADGRIVAMGGGGYNLLNVTNAWMEVVVGLTMEL